MTHVTTPGIRTVADATRKLGRTITVTDRDGAQLYAHTLTATMTRQDEHSPWTLDNITMSASRYPKGPFGTYDTIDVADNPEVAAEAAKLVELVEQDCAAHDAEQR